MTFGIHGTTTKKKAWEKAGHAQNLLLVRTTSGHILFRSRDFVTSSQKAPLWRIWRNFWLRMRIKYFRTVTDVTSGLVTDITSGHVTNITFGHVTDVTSGHAHWFDPPARPPANMT